MGVLNVTPDSFSDGGEFHDIERAVERALEIEVEGADTLDIGGESTRPGSRPISVDEELGRVIPVLERLRGRLKIPVSIDTTKPEVAEAAIAAGAEIINDVSGLRFNNELAQIAAGSGSGLVLMHSRGTPETMQKMAPVPDIFDEVIGSLRASIAVATSRGVSDQKIIIDPGIGFGKTREQNLELIDGLARLNEALGFPILLGTSRKSFLRLTLGKDDDASILGGTAASVAIGVERGARIVRVHDVREMVAVVRLTEGIRGQGSVSGIRD
jgi:dihydropteroate synthase